MARGNISVHPLQEARAVCQQKWVDNGFPATCEEHKFYTVLPKQRPGAIPAEQGPPDPLGTQPNAQKLRPRQRLGPTMRSAGSSISIATIFTPPQRLVRRVQ